ncbi:hypothetical protein PR202_ga18922 [Eleusine coracana subsp. coracana]|uniref:Uncharacterized protein n=1 Tax=Eleusine coracana subsp. coracana TaxID=191504 RepID=A0AAV5CUL9_ELECO|nr:hypothetical protein PR202_ga18922 [Eleusine coracana subsp. coracana]
MEFTRDIVVPAALSVIFERLLSSLVDHLPRPSSLDARAEDRRRLERLSSVVEEAEGRHITNPHLLVQLKSLTDAMYRGRFALDAAELEDIVKNDSVVTTTGKRKFALCSAFNAAKRVRLILGGNDYARVTTVLEDLETLTSDYTPVFVELMKGCVFGRHVETERVVAFLLKRAPMSTGLSALAVVGAKPRESARRNW